MRFLGLAWALGMTSCHSTPLPPAGGISSPVPAATLAVTVPDAAWHMEVVRVIELDREVWVLAQLQRKPGLAAQMIRAVEIALPTGLPAKPRRVFIAGKTWAWANPEAYDFVASLDPVIKQAGPARVIYPAPGGTR